LVSGNIETTLNKLTKKRKDYLREIKRTIASTLFGTIKTKTITRKHRRDIEGLKGRRKIKTKINVGLDTSGSMGGTFERVLSYIYQNDIEINFMESDTEVRWVKKLKSKKQIETIPIKGLGGTCLQPMIDYIVDNFNGVGNLLLTDGYTDSLDFSRVKGKTLIISIGVPCPILNDNGRVKQIVIDKDFS
jgi:predicted metal-dependent peptidase